MSKSQDDNSCVFSRFPRSANPVFGSSGILPKEPKQMQTVQSSTDCHYDLQAAVKKEPLTGSRGLISPWVSATEVRNLDPNIKFHGEMRKGRMQGMCPFIPNSDK